MTLLHICNLKDPFPPIFQLVFPITFHSFASPFDDQNNEPIVYLESRMGKSQEDNHDRS